MRCDINDPDRYHTAGNHAHDVGRGGGSARQLADAAGTQNGGFLRDHIGPLAGREDRRERSPEPLAGCGDRTVVRRGVPPRQTTLACAAGTLRADKAVCVVLASEGYPETSSSGDEITGLENIPTGVYVYHAGTEERDGRFYTA